MKQITLEQKMRAQGVTRWHIVRTSVKQSLAEHLYGTAMIADTMLMLYARFYLIESASFYRHWRSKIIDRALHHDMLEVLTGDAPSPYKQWCAAMFGRRPPEPSNLMWFEEAYVTAPHAAMTEQLLEALVKLADTVEAYHFIGRYAIDAHGHMVAARLNERLERSQEWMPERFADPEFTLGRTANRTNRGGPITDTGRVDWPAFVDIVFQALNQPPEEISDDESLAGGGLSQVDGEGDRGNGGQDGPDREPGAPG